MTMASIAAQMTAVYVFVDDYLKLHPALSKWRSSNNDAPAFTDAEVLTVALLQGCLGVPTLKQTHRFVAANHRAAFPCLPCYAQWLARLHALSAVVGHLIQAAAGQSLLLGELYLLDAKPVPMCLPWRNGRTRLLREDGACYGKTSTGWFFGFKLHVLVHHSGVLLTAILTPGNWKEQEVALALSLSVGGGIALADSGYRGAALRDELANQAQLLLLTPDAVPNDKARRVFLNGLRQRVETTFSALWERFVDRVYSRSWEGLWSTIKLKLLHFNLSRAGLIPG
jgi:transposase